MNVNKYRQVERERGGGVVGCWGKGDKTTAAASNEFHYSSSEFDAQKNFTCTHSTRPKQPTSGPRSLQCTRNRVGIVLTRWGTPTAAAAVAAAGSGSYSRDTGFTKYRSNFSLLLRSRTPRKQTSSNFPLRNRAPRFGWMVE